MSWKKYFKVVNTDSLPVMPTPTNDREGYGTTGRSASILPEVYAGSPYRIARYQQYSYMNMDSDINAALDTIADFCTQSEEQNDEPFEISYNEEANETEVTLIKTNLQLWVKLNDFKQRLWNIFRQTIMNGDQFFLRDPETAEWLWLDHFAVEMIKVDESNGKKPDEYIVRGLDLNRQAKFATRTADPTQYRTPYGPTMAPGGRQQTSGNQTSNVFQMAGGNSDPRQMSGAGQQMNELSVISAEHVIHLSLSVKMDINWPFGQSILDPIYKVYKQKELLEDSIIIYRVQRAPERRVFYIDVGTMPPLRAKAHLEQVKNELHQRRIPNRNGLGGSTVDATYNSMAMLDDIYLAQCLSQSTEIPLLDGRTLTLAEIIKEYDAGKINYTYSLDTKTHKFEVGKISWAGVTRKNAQILRVTLDNGKYVDATPDHRFILRDGSEIEAQYLSPGSSLMPLYLHESRTGPNQKAPNYIRIQSNDTGKSSFLHLLVCPKPVGRECVVHHKDFNSRNNNPENLEIMNNIDHLMLHKKTHSESMSRRWNDPSIREELINSMRDHYANPSVEFKQKLKEKATLNGAKTWENPESAKKSRDSLKIHSAKQAAKRKLSYNNVMFDRLVELYDSGYDSISKLCPVLKKDEVYQNIFKQANLGTKRAAKDGDLGSLVNDNTLNQIVKTAGYKGWSDFKQNYNHNHKVVSVEWLDYREDTADITVESSSDSHVFAVAAGIYVHNSAEGRGSKVETLPGASNLGEIGDLSFFTKKMARGLRIPTSYLPLGDDENTGNGSYNDGKLGAAMIQEFRFTKYCMRWQSLLAPVFDSDFKRFLKDNGIEIDPNLFELKFNPPQNFTKYRQIELDSQQMTVYQSIADNKKIAERMKFKRYLNWSEEEIIENERLWAEENAAKLKKTTGSTPAESEPEGDLGSVGIRGGMGDMGMDDFGDEMPPPDGAAPPEGGAAPNGEPVPPPQAGGQPPL